MSLPHCGHVSLVLNLFDTVSGYNPTFTEIHTFGENQNRESDLCETDLGHGRKPAVTSVNHWGQSATHNTGSPRMPRSFVSNCFFFCSSLQLSGGGQPAPTMKCKGTPFKNHVFQSLCTKLAPNHLCWSGCANKGLETKTNYSSPFGFPC